MIAVSLDEGLVNVSVLAAILVCFYPKFNTHAFGYCVREDVISQSPNSGGAHAPMIVRDLITNATTSSQSNMYMQDLHILTVVDQSLCTWARLCRMKKWLFSYSMDLQLG